MSLRAGWPFHPYAYTVMVDQREGDEQNMLFILGNDLTFQVSFMIRLLPTRFVNVDILERERDRY